MRVQSPVDANIVEMVLQLLKHFINCKTVAGALLLQILSDMAAKYLHGRWGQDMQRSFWSHQYFVVLVNPVSCRSYKFIGLCLFLNMKKIFGGM